MALQIRLTPSGYRGLVKEELDNGATPLPQIVPGAEGYYFKARGTDRNNAYAVLVRGRTLLNVQLEMGVAGRDNAADVLAMMKLIAPKLITDASAPDKD
ncbi:hypothetical protein DP939_37215 [Spongiactinospora rosea]|uniref:Uncharacterized protein n=1 Tax=Spongiactinospora rosea TaxID=2248750 RepID=A0A366LM95_9ACTN|nr:hypothetical protein DP939_37215 [Spongiactinospora rosea]